MTNSKLSALTELAATPATTDEVYIRNISEAAADQSKRITLANFLAAYNALVATLTNKSIAASQLTGIIADARMPDLTGDVTTVEGAVSTTIANDAVTYAKMQNVSATDRVLGRSSAGAGDVQEITMTALGRNIAALASLTDGGILIGAGTAAPTALGVATNGQIPIGDGTTAPVLATITAGTNITVTNGAGTITIAATGGSGALTRAGGNTTEATTTSTTAVDLLSATVSITGGTPVFITSILRKTAGAAASASTDLTLNTSVVTQAPVWTNSSDGAQSGWLSARFHHAITNYDRQGILEVFNAEGVTTATSRLGSGAAIPTATLTTIIIRGLVGNSLITMGADEMQVYTYAVS